MEWTYATYTIANYGITIGLVLVSIIGVFATFFSSKKGQEFVIERVIGVNPNKVHHDYDEHDTKQQDTKNLSLDANRQPIEPEENSLHMKQKSIFYIGIFCCLLGGMTLSITAVLMFQGCFLTDVRILPGDDCPEYSMDCFVFESSSFAPITNNVSFICDHLEKAQFPTNVSDATAWCYAWIIRLQSTKSVLDQLGVAIALIGFFTTMLAIIVYLGKCKKAVVLSITFILTCGIVMILLLIFKWSFAPLTYAILSLGVGLGIFGLVLFCILPKPKKQKNNSKILRTNINQPIAVARSVWTDPKRPGPTVTSSFQPKTTHGPSKVTPK